MAREAAPILIAYDGSELSRVERPVLVIPRQQRLSPERRLERTAARRSCSGLAVLVAGASRASMAGMDLVEIKQKDRMHRDEAAARLRELAEQLLRHNDVEFEREGVTFTVRVPDEVQLTVESEIVDDGRELEIELTC